MMTRPVHSSGGLALAAVLGLIAVLVVLLATARGAVLGSRSRDQLGTARLDAAQSVAALAALAIADSTQTAIAPGQPVLAPSGIEGRIKRAPLPAEDPLWRTLPGLRALPGDELLTIQLDGDFGPEGRARLIVNRRGMRPGVVPLP